MQKIVEKPEPPKQFPKRTMFVLLPIVLFAGLAVLFGYALRTADPSKLPSALLGRQAPAIDLPALAGLGVSGTTTADLSRGDVVVVNFWASWCGPCVQEHPLLSDLKQKASVRLIGINYKDPEPGGLRFLKRLGNPFDMVGVDGTGRTSIEWGVYGMPETFVLNGAGRIIFKHVGPLTADLVSNSMIPVIEAARKTKSP